MPEPLRRTLRAAVDPAAIRTARYQGRDHLVLPVVMLVGDSVIEPMGSDGPEFVPADVLAAAPGGWNGRPVLPDHPPGGAATANTPEVLERMACGQLFNTVFADGRLKTDAYVDPDRAERADGGGARMLRALRDKKVVDVSIGCFVEAVKEDGEAPDGTRYAWRWTAITGQDHLAIGLDGKAGACSVEDGCGAPRAAAAAINRRISRLRAAAEVTMSKRGVKPGVLERLFAALGSATDQRALEPDPNGETDAALRDALWQALRAEEPAFDYVESVVPETSTVLYWVSPEGEAVLYGRSFARGDDGAIMLNDDRAEFEPVTKYMPVAAAAAAGESSPDGGGTGGAAPSGGAPTGDLAKAVAATAAADGGCRCSSKESSAATGDDGVAAAAEPEPEGEGGNGMDKLKDAVGRLMQCAKLPAPMKNEAALTALGEAGLVALEAHYAAEPPPKAKEPAEPAPRALSRDEWLAAAPEDVRAALVRQERAEKAHRDRLIAGLRGAQTEFTAEELAAEPTERLEKMSRALKLDEPAAAPDYSGRLVADPKGDAAARAAATAAPNPWGLTFEGGVSKLDDAKIGSKGAN